MLQSIVIVSLVGAVSAEYSWNFENGTPEGLRLTNVSVTGAGEHVIEGTNSLLADSRENDLGWNEILKTDPQVCPLRPETAYTISFRYRAVEPLGEKSFYLLLRSDTAGKETGDRWGGWWEEFDGEPHTKNYIVRTGDAPDYHLIIGVRGPGAIVIDNLRIWAGQRPPGGVVTTGDFPLASKFEDWKKSAEETGIAAWMETAQNVIDPAGWRKWDGEYRDYLVNLHPDIVAYLGIDAVRDLGFFRTSASMEYQELYKFDAEKHGVPWEEMVDRFRESGLAIDLDGEPIMDQTWAAGGYFTCQAGSEWHEYYLDDLRNNLHRFDGLNQDNIGVVGTFKGRCAYCEGCQVGFREYLREKYAKDTLRTWGIPDLEEFDFLRFVLEHSLEGREALESPVVREYIKCYNLSQLAAWNDTARHVREWTEGKGPYPVYGNMIGAIGPIPYAVMLCPWTDVISMEHYWPSADYYKPPRFHGASWGYKVARSASGYPKPVFILNALEGEGGAAPYATTTEHTLAEGLANGGYRVYSPGANIPKYGGKQPLDHPEIRKLHERYAAFIRKYRGLFWGTEPAHRAVVIYSIPTHMFHRFPALRGFNELDEYRRFAAACLLMEIHNIPYDVLVLPHPELMPELGWEKKLENCDLAVFPGVIAIARDQAEVFEAYLKKGGRILAFEPFAERDENYNRVDGLFASKDSERVMIVKGWDQTLGNELWNRKANNDIVQRVGETLDGLYPTSVRQVKGEIPEEVTVNAWEDRDGRFFAVHLVNYGWVVEEDRVTGLRNLEIEVELPERFREFSPILLSPELDAPVEVTHEKKAGRCRVTIPLLGVYALIVWGDWDFIQGKTDYAKVMNLGIRMTKVGDDLPPRWWERLRKEWEKGEYGEVRSALENWQVKAEAVERAFLEKERPGHTEE
jgi:hypothetical protein